MTLPTAVVAALGLLFSHMGRAFLAIDDVVSFDVHDVIVFWDGQPRNIKADPTGSTPTGGMSLLDGHDVSIQVRSGGRVLIQDAA